MKTSQIVWRIVFGIVVFTLASFAMLSAVWWIRNYNAYSYGLDQPTEFLGQTGVMGAVAIAFGCFFTGLVFYDRLAFAEEVIAFKKQVRIFFATFLVVSAVTWAYLNVIPQWTAYEFTHARHSQYAVEIRALESWPKGYFWDERPILALLDMKQAREQYNQDLFDMWGDPANREKFFAKYFKAVPDSEYLFSFRQFRSQIGPTDEFKPILIPESEVEKYRAWQESRWKYLKGVRSKPSLRASYSEPGWGFLAAFYRAIGLTFLPSVLLILGFASGLFLHVQVNPKYHRLAILASMLVMIIVFVPKHYDPVVSSADRITKFLAYAPLSAEAFLLALGITSLLVYRKRLLRLEKEARIKEPR